MLLGGGGGRMYRFRRLRPIELAVAVIGTLEHPRHCILPGELNLHLISLSVTACVAIEKFKSAQFSSGRYPFEIPATDSVSWLVARQSRGRSEAG